MYIALQDELYIVMKNGPFHKTPVYAYYNKAQAQAFCDKMNAESPYKYYVEEVEIGG
jgi:hypothetical protein